MNRSEGSERINANTDIYSTDLIIAAFDRAFTNLNSDFLAHYLLKNDETFEKLIKLLFEFDKLFQKLEDRNIQSLEISQSSVTTNGETTILRQYYYRRLKRRINVASFKFETENLNSKLYIKELNTLDYKCELLMAVQK